MTSQPPNPVTDAERMRLAQSALPEYFSGGEGDAPIDRFFLGSFGMRESRILDYACLLQRRVDELERRLLPEPVPHVAPPMPEDDLQPRFSVGQRVKVARFADPGIVRDIGVNFPSSHPFHKRLRIEREGFGVLDDGFWSTWAEPASISEWENSQ